MAQYERRLIGSRTREAMAAAKARGCALDGRWSTLWPRGSCGGDALLGATLQQIADRLTAEGVATQRGGRWHLSTVKRILDSDRLDAEAAGAQARIESEALLAVESFEAV